MSLFAISTIALSSTLKNWWVSELMKNFKTIGEYCAAIQIPPPRHEQFDIRSFEENMPTVINQMPPFRHAFYAIAIKVGGKGKALTSHFQDFPEGSAIFFNSPFQIISWDIAPDWEGYYVMMTQEFLTQSGFFNDLLVQFPFLKIEKSIPFPIDEADAATILDIYQKIQQEYHEEHRDKFDFINAYVLLLLQHVKRYFGQQVSDESASRQLRNADLTILSRYQKLIETKLRLEGSSDETGNLHSPSFYADLLNIHPNYLNSVVKANLGKTALQLIHHHLLHLAKSYLVQTDLSIKEIAYQLQFDSPNNFNNFFKKHTQQTPGRFRKATQL